MLRFTGTQNSNNYPAVEQGNVGEYLIVDTVQAKSHRDCYTPFARAWSERPTHPNPLVTKLETFAQLGAEDIGAIEALSRNPKPYRAEQVLIHEGSSIGHVCLIVEGLACRYKLLPGGRRQIMGYLIPGDLCDVHFVVFNKPDHSVALVGDSTVVKIPTHKIMELIVRYPRIERALSLASLIDNAILREWLLNIGQRDALQKLSHLFCEMSVRLKAIGRVHEDGSFDLPANQVTLADTIGLTSVHINRTLQRLRTDGLIRLRHRRLTILDMNRLAAIAGFDESYLRMRRPLD